MDRENSENRAANGAGEIVQQPDKQTEQNIVRNKTEIRAKERASKRTENIVLTEHKAVQKTENVVEYIV